MDFQNFTFFFKYELEHRLDHFTLGLVFHKRPLADKTIICTTNISSITDQFSKRSPNFVEHYYTDNALTVIYPEPEWQNFEYSDHRENSDYPDYPEHPEHSEHYEYNYNLVPQEKSWSWNNFLQSRQFSVNGGVSLFLHIGYFTE